MRTSPSDHARRVGEQRGLLQLVAYQPIAVDGAGADGSAEGAVGVDPDPSNDHGGVGASTAQGTSGVASWRSSAAEYTRQMPS